MANAPDLTPQELVTTVYLFRSARRGWLSGHGPLAITLERAEAENGCVIDHSMLLALQRKHVITAREDVHGSTSDVLLFLNEAMAESLHV